MKKTKLTSKDLLHLAKLSALDLSPQEQKKIETQFAETLDYVQNLDELKTDNTEPTNHTVNLQNEFFEDGEKNERKMNQKEVFYNAKNKKGNFFSVKKIL